MLAIVQGKNNDGLAFMEEKAIKRRPDTVQANKSLPVTQIASSRMRSYLQIPRRLADESNQIRRQTVIPYIPHGGSPCGSGGDYKDLLLTFPRTIFCMALRWARQEPMALALLIS